MKNIVLAAGYATRLYPLTENFPKPLLDVAGKPILNWLLDDIDQLPEIDEHIIISNHRYAAHFENWAKTAGFRCPVRVLDDGSVSNETRLGAVKDLQFAIDTLHIDEDILVIAGDNMVDFSFRKFLDYYAEKQAASVMVNRETEVAELRRCGVAVMAEDGRVLSMEEKPQHPKSEWCVGPFYLYKKEQLPLIPKAIADGCGTDAPGSLVAYLCERIPVYGMEIPKESRYDIGTLESYEAVKTIFAQRN